MTRGGLEIEILEVTQCHQVSNEAKHGKLQISKLYKDEKGGI